VVPTLLASAAAPEYFAGLFLASRWPGSGADP